MADNSNKPDNWQPIESAPKDGKSILCYHPFRNGYGRTCILRWDLDELNGGAKPEWRTDVVSFVAFKPTHWMPLPPPPEGQ